MFQHQNPFMIRKYIKLNILFIFAKHLNLVHFIQFIITYLYRIRDVIHQKRIDTIVPRYNFEDAFQIILCLAIN